MLHRTGDESQTQSCSEERGGVAEGLAVAEKLPNLSKRDGRFGVPLKAWSRKLGIAGWQ